MEYKPKDYQRKAARYITNHSRCMLCMEPGMGKISAVLTALNSLKYDCFDKSRTVVITAQTDAGNRWIPELHKWNHLNGLTARRAYGSKAADEASGICDITFTSPGMCHDIISRIGKDSLTLVVDRAYTLQNTASKEYAEIKRAADKASRLVIICDWNMKSDLGILWNILYLIDSGERLGRNRATFLDRFFYRHYEKRNGHKVCINEPKPQSWDTIKSLIGDVCFEVTERGSRSFNGGTVINRYIVLNREQYSEYLLTARVAEVATSMLGSGKAGCYTDAASQYADGIVRRSDGSIALSHTGKIHELRRLLESMPYTRAVIVVPYEFYIGMVMKNIPGITEIRNSMDFLRWWSGERMTAIVWQDSRAMPGIMKTFHKGLIITFRNNSICSGGERPSAGDILQCNILLDGACGY